MELNRDNTCKMLWTVTFKTTLSFLLVKCTGVQCCMLANLLPRHWGEKPVTSFECNVALFIEVKHTIVEPFLEPALPHSHVLTF